MNLSITHNKQEALQEIVDIATRHKINAAEIKTALGHSQTSQAHQETQKSVMSRLFIYIGGTFIFSGICVFIAMFWEDFSPLFRILITFGTGTSLFIAAIGCAKNPQRQSLVTPLVLASAIFQPAGLFVMLDEYGSGGDFRHAVLMISSAMLLQYVMTFVSIKRDILASLALLTGGALFATAADLLDMSHNLVGIAIGISYLCLATAFHEKVSVRHSGFWHMVGGFLLIGSFYDVVRDSALEVAFPGLCAMLVYLSIVVKSRGLLIISTLSMIWYIGGYAFDMFADNGLFPLGLIVAGGTFMGLGSLAMRLDRRFIKQV